MGYLSQADYSDDFWVQQMQGGSIWLRAPRSQRERLLGLFGHGGDKILNGMNERISSLHSCGLSFTRVSASATWLNYDYYRACCVEVSALATNNTGHEVPASALPMPLCVELMECSDCSLGEDGRGVSISAGETLPVSWYIYARDVFEWWALAQIDDDPFGERVPFLGLDALPEVITGALRRAFEKNLRGSTAIRSVDGGDATDYEQYSFPWSRTAYITRKGSCFHYGDCCHRSPELVRIRDAYLSGYSACEKCAGTDWWVRRYLGLEFTALRPGGFAFPNIGSIWISSAGGLPIAKLDPDEYVEDDSLRVVYDLCGDVEPYGIFLYGRPWDMLCSMSREEIISRFLVTTDDPEIVSENRGCHYLLNRQALDECRAEGWPLRGGHPSESAEKIWLQFELEKLRTYYQMAKGDGGLLEALFPGRSIGEVISQAEKMGLC